MFVQEWSILNCSLKFDKIQKCVRVIFICVLGTKESFCRPKRKRSLREHSKGGNFQKGDINSYLCLKAGKYHFVTLNMLFHKPSRSSNFHKGNSNYLCSKTRKHHYVTQKKCCCTSTARWQFSQGRQDSYIPTPYKTHNILSSDSVLIHLTLHHHYP